jgi:hypothetical protein
MPALFTIDAFHSTARLRLAVCFKRQSAKRRPKGSISGSWEEVLSRILKNPNNLDRKLRKDGKRVAFAMERSYGGLVNARNKDRLRRCVHFVGISYLVVDDNFVTTGTNLVGSPARARHGSEPLAGWRWLQRHHLVGEDGRSRSCRESD